MTDPLTLTESEIRRLTGYKRPADVSIAPFVLGPSVEAYAAHVDHEEVQCGIYALFADGGRLLYIGKGGDLKHRITAHWYAMRRRARSKFSYYLAIEVPPIILRDVEVAHIYALTPPENLLYEEPRHPEHDALVATVQSVWAPFHVERV